jgi:hypothetical protein
MSEQTQDSEVRKSRNQNPEVKESESAEAKKRAWRAPRLTKARIQYDTLSETGSFGDFGAQTGG